MAIPLPDITQQKTADQPGGGQHAYSTPLTPVVIQQRSRK